MEEKRKNEMNLKEVNSIADVFLSEAVEDKKNYKIAILVAVVAHILLITTVFPNVGAEEIEIKPKIIDQPIRVVIIPPVEDLPDVVLEKKRKKVAVPDSNPDEIEPLAEVDTDLQNEEIDPGEFIVFNEEPEPPIEKAVIKAGTYGLENPVYNRSELQRNAVYPPLGIKARVQGRVILEVVLKKDGTVGEVKVIGGLNILGFPQSAINAVKRLSFTPGKFHGIPVDVVMVLTVNYQLRK